MERQFNLLVGSPGSGKSTFTVPIIKAYKQNVIIVKHTSNINDKTHSFLNEKNIKNWRKGYAPSTFAKCKMAYSDRKDYVEFLTWIKKNYRNGLLIIDDATIFERDRMSLEMVDLVAMRRHYGIDIMLIYHGFSMLPIDQFIFANNLIIFNTNDNFSYKSNKIPQYERVIAAISQSKHNFQSNDKKIKYKPTIVDITSM